jgi:hypothetical protein
MNHAPTVDDCVRRGVIHHAPPPPVYLYALEGFFVWIYHKDSLF